jgi:hypothetical protein
MNSIDLDTLVWVELTKPDNFLIIKETLTRIGIASKLEKKLTQTCHILHKRGKYAIVHFKELFLLDGKTADLTEEDIARRNTIVNLLEDWDLLKQEKPEMTEKNVASISNIKIIPSKEKSNWTLVSKYTIGNKK